MDLNASRALIAILRGVTLDDIEAQVDALIDSGIRLIEIPTNSPDWRESIRRAVHHAGERALLGAGTVLSTGDADALLAAGGKLMVTPNTDPVVIRHGVRLGLTCAAGFATATEAFAAIAAGAQALKLFPAAQFGCGYVRALKAVFPAHIPVFAVGGITADNLPEFLHAGCRGAGLGSDLYAPSQTAAATRERAARFVCAYDAAMATVAPPPCTDALL